MSLFERIVTAVANLTHIEREGDAHIVIWSSGSQEQIEAIVAEFTSEKVRDLVTTLEAVCLTPGVGNLVPCDLWRHADKLVTEAETNDSRSD